GRVAGEAVHAVGVVGGGGGELLGGGEGFRLVERLGVGRQGRGEERDGDVGVGAGQRRVAAAVLLDRTANAGGRVGEVVAVEDDAARGLGGVPVRRDGGVRERHEVHGADAGG